MGNEMGNNNVSGTQEQENTKVEAANKSSEVFQASINAGDVKAKNQPVASKKEEGFHEKLTGLSSEEPSGVSVAHIEKDGREQENTEVEATNRIPEASLASITAGNITAKNQPVPSMKDDISHEKHTGLSSDEEPSGVTHPHIETDSSDEREPDKTEVQVSDESAKAPVSPNDSKDQKPQSVSSAVDGNFHETDSAFENSSGIGTTEHEVQKELSIGRDGEELKSSSLDSESSPQDPGYVDSVCIPAEHVVEGSKPEGSDEDVLGLNGPYRDIEKNEEKLEHTLEASIISSTDSVVATSKDDGPNEDREMGCQEEVVDLSNCDEKMVETTNGVEVGKPPIDADEKEGDKEVQLKAVAATNSLESFQGEAPESDAILIIPTEVTKIVENETGEQDYCHSSITLTDHGSLEESKLTNMNSNGSEFIMGMGAEHEEKKKGSEKESQTDVTIIAENENQVVLHDRKMSLSYNENVTDLEKEDEPVIETLTEITAVTTNIDEEKGKEGDLYSPDSVMFSSCQTELEENLVKTYPVSSDQFQDGKQKSTLLESEMQENLRSLILESNQESHNKTEDIPDSEFLTIETSVQHEAFDISIEQSQLNEPARDQDSNTALGTLETHESSGTGSNQEVLKNPIADTEDSSKESRKEDAEHLNTNVKVTEVFSYDLLPPEVQHDDSVPTALLYQVNTSKTDDLSVGNSVAETEFAAVEKSEVLVEKQVIALETTDPEKLKTPLLSYLEEENNVVETPKKQERHVLKKTDGEEMLNLLSSSSPPDKHKRKQKYSLFSNCICCTAVIQ